MLALSAAQPPVGGQAARAVQDYQSGPYLYRVFCVSCHGATGKGDGPVAFTLRQTPSDLTRIASRRAGVFPRDEITRMVDGREMVKSHSEMPAWGQKLQPVEGHDERLILQRIDALVSYLATIQVRP